MRWSSYQQLRLDLSVEWVLVLSLVLVRTVPTGTPTESTEDRLTKAGRTLRVIGGKVNALARKVMAVTVRREGGCRSTRGRQHGSETHTREQ